jgi:hypothetical protein
LKASQWQIPSQLELRKLLLIKMATGLRKNNRIEITGLFDKEEQALKESYVKLLKDKSDTIPFKKLMGKFFFNPIFSPPNSDTYTKYYYRISSILFCNFSEKIMFKFYPVNTPPPDMCRYI